MKTTWLHSALLQITIFSLFSFRANQKQSLADDQLKVLKVVLVCFAVLKVVIYLSSVLSEIQIEAVEMLIYQV